MVEPRLGISNSGFGAQTFLGKRPFARSFRGYRKSRRTGKPTYPILFVFGKFIWVIISRAARPSPSRKIILGYL